MIDKSEEEKKTKKKKCWQFGVHETWRLISFPVKKLCATRASNIEEFCENRIFLLPSYYSPSLSPPLPPMFLFA